MPGSCAGFYLKNKHIDDVFGAFARSIGTFFYPFLAVFERNLPSTSCFTLITAATLLEFHINSLRRLPALSVFVNMV